MKKFISGVMALALAFSVGSTALAVEPTTYEINPEEEIERALNGETDLELDTSNMANAYIENEDGSIETVDTYVTTRALPMTLSADESEQVYATTVVASARAKDKTEVNSKEQDYVTATVTLYWTDVTGTANKFGGASGSWARKTDPSTNKLPTLSNRKVSVRGTGTSASNKGDWYYAYPSSNTFEIGASAYEDGWWAYTVTSEVRINSSSTLTVSASSGMFG